MRKFFFSLIITFLLALPVFATQITVNPFQLTNWTFGGSSAQIRIFSNQKFVTSDGQIIMQSLPTSASWYRSVNCTVSGSTLNCNSFTIDSTTDSSNPNATYIAYLYDANNTRRDTLLSSFKVPTSLGTTVNWAQILTYNQNAPNPPPAGFYTNDQVNAIIAASLANAVQITSSRVEKDQSLYGNSLATAVSTLCPAGSCSVPTLLNITRQITINTSLTVPRGLTLNLTGEGKLTLSPGVTLTINNFSDPGNRQVFDSSASGAKVLFGKGAVEKLKIAWWVGTVSGTNVTDALAEALETANANQTPIRFPQGLWLTSGDHQIGEGVTIEGEGNHLISNLGTILKLSSPTANAIFKIGEINYSVRFENIVFSGTGTTGKYGVHLQGSYPNSSGDVYFHKVTFENFEIGLFHDDVVTGAGNSWQVAQIQINQSIFFHNNIGIKTESLNSALTVTSTNFYNINNQTALYFQGVGITTITGCEFAGTGAGAVNQKAIVIAGAHVQINIISNQDEGNSTFLENNASDITGIVNLYGNLIQAKLQINYTMTLNSTGNNYPPDAIRITPPATPHIFSQNDNIRTDIGTEEAPGVVPANPLRLVKSDDPITQFEFNPILGQTDWRRGAFTVRQRSRFILPDYLEGNPNEPLVSIMHASTVAESQKLLRLGRISHTDTFTDEFYYDVWRSNNGNDAGRLKIEGNQTGYVGLDLNGDFSAVGAIRGGACQRSDNATITLDPRCGNHVYVTLGGNRTLAMPIMTADEKLRADGQRITVELVQDATGSRTITLPTGAGQFAFGTDLPSVTLTTTANKRDILTIIYSSRMDRWLVVDFKKGF